MDKLWTFFMNLGANMWGDPWSKKPTAPVQCDGAGRYYKTLPTERDVWRRVVDALPEHGINALVIDIGEGVRYESHPELAVEGSWSVEELRSELARIRALGIEPIPKLNFSACHDAWLGEYAYMLSTRKYYEVVTDLIREVSDIFGHPRYFHLGMDEEDYPDHHTGMTSIRSNDLWWHDIAFLFDAVEREGARPWIWSDYYWGHQEEFAKRMSHDCVQSNWRYEKIQPKRDGRYPQIGYQTYLDFSRLGFDQIPTATDWCFRQNMAETVWLFLTEEICDEHLLGFLSVPWLLTTDVNYYSLMNNAHRLGHARKMLEEYTPERREEMCLRIH